TSMWPSWSMVSQPGAHSGCPSLGSLCRLMHRTVRGRNIEGGLSAGRGSTRRLGTRPSVDYLPLDYPGYGRGTGHTVYLVYVASSRISDLTECPGVSERSVYSAL